MKLNLFFLLLIHFQTFAADFDFIMLRHAKAPGTGDPQNFQLKDCKTQRNLSREGIAQAKKIGQELPLEMKVYSSQWCRCLETAKYLNREQVHELELLNSFYQAQQKKDPQTEKLKDWILREVKLKKPFLLVTHQVNITALIDVFPEEGELLYVKVDEQKRLNLVERKAIKIEEKIGAGNGTQTRDLCLGKASLYQLSYSRN